MMLFKKQHDLVNKLNHMEYVFNDRLNDIQSKLDDTLSNKLNNFETKINEILNIKINEKADTKDTKYTTNIEEFSNTLNILNNKMNNIEHNIEHIQREQIIKTEENLKKYIDETKDELLEKWKTTDLSLRTDLQTFLLGLQKDIIHNICSQTNLAIEQTKELKSSILLVGEQVNKFYYDNELVKHQLLLEQEIRNYNDEIESIKFTANNLKNTIDDILKNYDFET